MVSLWPWKSDDTSPASFEKTLSTLSAKITKSSAKVENLRQRSRRFSVLWTLYAVFAYLLCTVILVLVVGWREWGPSEYTGVSLGPAVIYLGRLILSTYYDYRISTFQSQLDDLEKQRNQTIDKLKEATKYNSTQELLKKYGGTPTPREKPKKSEGKSSPQQKQNAPSQSGRTNILPPPTANIPNRRHTFSPQNTPNTSPPQQYPPSNPPEPSHPSPPASPDAEFAPNAFPAPLQYAQNTSGPRWYDRFIDVLLGEDENSPGNRMALICSQCRLVNGQAPPGVRKLADVGRWKCMGCGSMNGDESDDVGRIVRGITAEAREKEKGGEGEKEEKVGKAKGKGKGRGKVKEEQVEEESESESDVTQYTDEEKEPEIAELEAEMQEKSAPRRRSTRVRQKNVDFDE